jgi:MarR-like DNA-binding transcriptional regulator SgrR of sgrS sRNA
MPASFAVDNWRSSVVYAPDVYVSYSQLNCEGTEFHVYSPAPFFVALIPNVSRPVNRNALLTTALRYKIDTSRLSSAFEFGSVPQQSFLPNNLEYSAYTSDAAKGKKLLKESKSGATPVSIDCYSPTLGSTCRFLRGTLVQAGYSTETVGWNEPSDLRLMIVPIYSDSPWVALREVLTSIAKDTVAKDRANQPIRLADRLLSDAMQTSDSTHRTRLLERVDRILMEDIGAFPLFRPIIHVCAKEEIRGLRFDKDGRIDIRNIYRLKLPSDSLETKP